MKTLKEQIEYVEHHSGTIVTACKMYRRRHLFEGDDGNIYIELAIAGIDKFKTTQEAMEAVDTYPKKYVLAKQ